MSVPKPHDEITNVSEDVQVDAGGDEIEEGDEEAMPESLMPGQSFNI